MLPKVTGTHCAEQPCLPASARPSEEQSLGSTRVRQGANLSLFEAVDKRVKLKLLMVGLGVNLARANVELKLGWIAWSD